MRLSMSIAVGCCVLMSLGCKQPRYAQVDEPCAADQDCDSGLTCKKALRAHAVCMKPCGQSALEAKQGHDPKYDPPIDTSCPSGWACNATLSMKFVDRAGKDQGAGLGLLDRPYCVPNDWRPSPTP